MPHAALAALPAIIKVRCRIREACPNFVAALKVLGMDKDITYVSGFENGGTFGATIPKDVPVLRKPTNHTLLFECLVIWMAGNKNETIKKQKAVKLQCKYIQRSKSMLETFLIVAHILSSSKQY